MAENTNIEWATHTFNCWRGCTKVSAGCANCYAETMSGRNPKTLGVWGPNGTRVVAAEAAWKEPLKWDRKAAEVGERHRVFCASLADVFEKWPGNVVDSHGRALFITRDGGWTHAEDDVPTITLDDVRERLWRLIEKTPNLDWLLLTKRPQNFVRMLPGSWLKSPRPNVWLGTSVEDQAAADARIPRLLDTPAAIRFLSCEPLLGPVDLRVGIDWVIVGGESGPGARPCNVEWIRSIVAQCKAAGTACFVKQLGAQVALRNDRFSEWPHEGDGLLDLEDWPNRNTFQGEMVHVRMADRKGGDWSEWPVDLRFREFPKTA